MSRENVDLVRSLYESFAKGDVPAVIAAMDSRIEWNEGDGKVVKFQQYTDTAQAAKAVAG